MARDVLIEEAIKARLRPFAVAAARKAKKGGLGDLTRAQIIEDAIEVAARAALNGVLPDAGTMTKRQYDEHITQIYDVELHGLGDLSGWTKKLRSSIRKIGRKIEGEAKRIGRQIDDANRKIIREVVIPVTAPTIAHNMDKRDDYKDKAAAAWARYVASGHTDAAAYLEWKGYKDAADKRLDKIQDTVKAAAAVVGATVLLPAIAAPLNVANAGASAAGATVASQVKEAATAAVIEKVVEEIRPQAVEAAQDYQDAKAALADPNDGQLPAGPVQSQGGNFLLPAAAAVLTALAFS